MTIFEPSLKTKKAIIEHSVEQYKIRLLFEINSGEKLLNSSWATDGSDYHNSCRQNVQVAVTEAKRQLEILNRSK